MTITVLGLGSIGMRHASNLLDLGESVIGYDPSPERCALLKEAGGQVVSEAPDALNDSEAVIICSPNAYHFADIQLAIENNCHVLVEKPLSHTLDGVENLLALAKSKNLTVAAAMNLRFHPVVQRAKEILSGDECGNIIWGHFSCSSYLPDWRPHQDYRKGYTTDAKTGGVLFDIIHEFDLAQFLLGATEVKSCVARKTGLLETAAEDCADLIFTHPDNVQSSLHLDYASKNSQRVFEIQCENGLIRGDLIGRSIAFVKSGETDAIKEKFEGGFPEDYIEEMKGFLSAIRNKNGQICDASEAYDVLKSVIEAREIAGLEK